MLLVYWDALKGKHKYVYKAVRTHTLEGEKLWGYLLELEDAQMTETTVDKR